MGAGHLAFGRFLTVCRLGGRSAPFLLGAAAAGMWSCDPGWTCHDDYTCEPAPDAAAGAGARDDAGRESGEVEGELRIGAETGSIYSWELTKVMGAGATSD